MEEVGFLGIWADARKNFLMNERPDEYRELCESGKLREYLLDYQEEYFQKSDDMRIKMEEAEGATEELKVNNYMEYLGLVMRINAEIRQTLIEEICQ